MRHRFAVLAFDNAETHSWAPITTMLGTSALEVRSRFFRENPAYVSSAQHIRVRKAKPAKRAESLPWWVRY